MPTVEPSKSAVRRAGSTVRKWNKGECDPDQYEEALDVITAYRATFSEPLNYVLAELNTFIDPSDIADKASHRLKKVPTIIDKLSRIPGLDMSRMQDLGGCRVVFKKVDDLYFFADQVRLRWDGCVDHEKDYIAEPRDSGYRGIHIIIMQDKKPIEIQLRTKIMHDWAELVEGFSRVARENFKQDGDHLVQEFLKLYAKVCAKEDGLHRETITDEEFDSVRILGHEVQKYLTKLQDEA